MIYLLVCSLCGYTATQWVTAKRANDRCHEFVRRTHQCLAIVLKERRFRSIQPHSEILGREIVML